MSLFIPSKSDHPSLEIFFHQTNVQIRRGPYDGSAQCSVVCFILSVPSLGFKMSKVPGAYSFKTQAVFASLLTITVTLNIHQIILEFLYQSYWVVVFFFFNRYKFSILKLFATAVLVFRGAFQVCWLWLCSSFNWTVWFKDSNFSNLVFWEAVILTCPLRSYISSSVRSYWTPVTLFE